MLVSIGGNIYAENSKGYTPLSLVKNTDLKADVMYLTRRSLLIFFEEVSIADGLKNKGSLERVAANIDLMRYIVGCL